MAKDPICGMTVDESSLLRAEREGQTFYFCSEHCRQKFTGQARSGKTIPLAPTETGGCCGGADAKSASGSGDCCGGKQAQEQPENAALWS